MHLTVAWIFSHDNSKLEIVQDVALHFWNTSQLAASGWALTLALQNVCDWPVTFVQRDLGDGQGQETVLKGGCSEAEIAERENCEFFSLALTVSPLDACPSSRFPSVQEFSSCEQHTQRPAAEDRLSGPEIVEQKVTWPSLWAEQAQFRILQWSISQLITQSSSQMLAAHGDGRTYFSNKEGEQQGQKEAIIDKDDSKFSQVASGCLITIVCRGK